MKKTNLLDLTHSAAVVPLKPKPGAAQQIFYKTDCFLQMNYDFLILQYFDHFH